MQCAICGDELRANAAAAAEQVTFCGAGCGNNVHVQCIHHWLSTRAAQALSADCPFCRARFVDGVNPPADAPRRVVNLAAASEAHRDADTSLHALYGDRAIWIQAATGQVRRGEAAASWRVLHG